MSPARQERFATEQRTLAQMTHPSIARLYDADTLADGTPWFAMEYVEGVPIAEYCRQRDCLIDEIFRLFRSVCEAVQYAHGRAIVHCDLKAVEHIGESGWDGEAAGFRSRPADGRRSAAGRPDPYRVAAHDGCLRGAGADAVGSARHPGRRLRAGRHPLRIAHRTAAVRFIQP